MMWGRCFGLWLTAQRFEAHPPVMGEINSISSVLLRGVWAYWVLGMKFKFKAAANGCFAPKRSTASCKVEPGGNSKGS